MNERTKEIKRILRGHFSYENEGTLIVATQNPLKIQSDGMFFGIDNTRLLGVSVRMRQYAAKKRLPAAEDACVHAMLRQGWQIILRSAPNTLAILYYPAVSNPAVLTLDEENGEFLLCFYTARSLWAKRRAKQFFGKWEELTSAYLATAGMTAAPVSQKRSRSAKGKASRGRHEAKSKLMTDAEE